MDDLWQGKYNQYVYNFSNAGKFELIRKVNEGDFEATYKFIYNKGNKSGYKGTISRRHDEANLFKNGLYPALPKHWNKYLPGYVPPHKKSYEHKSSSVHTKGHAHKTH